ncbi:MAG: hypothetical protein ACR2OO_03925 [Thermomicrobiales bacterium]
MVPDAIPDALRSIPQWVGWRWKHVPDRRKPWTKPPVDPRTGRAASVNDPSTWGAFAEALSAMERFRLPGVGLVLTANLGLVGGDGDGCGDQETGVPDADAAGVLADVATYAERSPSGTGFRFFAWGDLPARVGDGARHGRHELYRAGRFLTLTGHRFPFAPATVEARGPELSALCDRLIPERGPAATAAPSPVIRAASGAGDSDAETVRRAMAARNGAAFAALFVSGDTAAHGGDDSRADEALCCHLAFWTRDPSQIDRLFRRSGLMRAKWERADYRARTIDRALRLVGEQAAPAAPALAMGRGGAGGRRTARWVEFVGGKAVQR